MELSSQISIGLENEDGILQNVLVGSKLSSFLDIVQKYASVGDDLSPRFALAKNRALCPSCELYCHQSDASPAVRWRNEG